MGEIPTFDFEPIDRGFCGVCLTGSSKSQSESSLISMGTGLEGFLGGALMWHNGGVSSSSLIFIICEKSTLFEFGGVLFAEVDS